MDDKYIPLYRKYRPSDFASVIGQENIVRGLSNAIKLNKIAHAYLFCGPRGTGKTSMARILAKSLNCKNGPTLEPCGVCPSCSDIQNSIPTDVIEIDAASNRSVEDAQHILEKIQYVPVNGKFKIYIIDEVHMLSNHAFNALLKTLEEPPENVVFILATTEIHKVLDTIISRCQRFDFRRITIDDIVAHLKKICKKEEINISDDAILNIAKSAQGGLRDALALLDQVSILGNSKTIENSDIDELLGKVSFENLFSVSMALKSKNTSETLIWLDKIVNKGNEPLNVISNLIQFYRNLLVVKSCNDETTLCELVSLNKSAISQLKQVSSDYDKVEILDIIERLSYYSKEIKNSSNRYMWLELSLIELSSDEKIQNITKQKISYENVGIIKKPKEINLSSNSQNDEQKIQKIDENLIKNEQISAKNEQKIDENEQKIAKNESVLTKNEVNIQKSNVDTSDITKLWISILQNIQSLPTKTWFSTFANPIEISQEKMVISFTKDNYLKKAQEPQKKSVIENAAKEYLGVKSIDIQMRLNSQIQNTVSKPIVEKINTQKNPENKPDKSIEQIEADEYADSILKKEESVKKNYSDQSKMVAELFEGKYLD